MLGSHVSTYVLSYQYISFSVSWLVVSGQFYCARKVKFIPMTETVCGIYEECLQIKKERIYVKYEEISKWGWNGHNF